MARAATLGSAVSSVEDAIRREFDAAAREQLVVRQVRVTPDAIAGSVMLAPMAPERLDEWGAMIREVAGIFNIPPRYIIAAPDAVQRWREILVHPTDWAALRHEVGNGERHVAQAWNVPVAR